MLLFFYQQNELIFRSNDSTIDEHAFEFRRLCISQSLIVEILDIIHEIVNEYSKFDNYAIIFIIAQIIKSIKQKNIDFMNFCNSF